MTLKSTYFPDKTFESKEDLVKAMRENLDDIIAFKKAKIQKSTDKGITVNCRPIQTSKYAETNKQLNLDENYYYIAVNSTMVLDSHDDMHDNGIWDKSIKEQQGRNYLVEDHELEVSKTIVRKEHIEMLTMMLPFSALGFDYEGETQVLVYKFPKNKVTKEYVKEWLDSGDSIEASVRMQYVKLEFAVDSNAPEDKEYKARYDLYIDKIANKSQYEEIPYFFIIKEAKNVSESSLVLFGSNNVTGNIKEADIVTPEIIQTEPLQDAPKPMDWAKIINNIKI